MSGRRAAGQAGGGGWGGQARGEHRSGRQGVSAGCGVLQGHWRVPLLAFREQESVQGFPLGGSGVYGRVHRAKGPLAGPGAWAVSACGPAAVGCEAWGRATRGLRGNRVPGTAPTPTWQLCLGGWV